MARMSREESGGARRGRRMDKYFNDEVNTSPDGSKGEGANASRGQGEGMATLVSVIDVRCGKGGRWDPASVGRRGKGNGAGFGGYLSHVTCNFRLSRAGVEASA